MKKDLPLTLLTGGTGFLGSRLVNEFVQQKLPIVVLKRSTSNIVRLKHLESDLTFYDIDRKSLREVFQRHKFDRIIHCATNYGRDNEPPSQIIEANLVLPLNLLQLAAEFGVREFFNTDTVLPKHINHYALSKKQFVDWMMVFSHQVSCTNVALEHFYGPGDDRSKFVTHLILSMLDGTPSLDLTPGHQKRDFIYIDDVLKAFFCLFDKLKDKRSGFRNYEVGTGKSVSIRRFVKMTSVLCRATDIQLNFGAVPYRENEIMESNVNITPLRELGWHPLVSLNEGLQRTIEYEKASLKSRVNRPTPFDNASYPSNDIPRNGNGQRASERA